MSPAIMPWPMTLAPTNEAIGCEHNARGGNYRHDSGGHARCKDSITIKKCKVL
jgi:hypothetical protein